VLGSTTVLCLLTTRSVRTRRFTFRQPRMRCIVPDTQGAGTRLLLLSEAVKDPGQP